MQTSAGPVPDDAAHLLVVDDDRRIRDALSRYLQREGYRVTTAKDADDARGKLDGLAFDLLILDVMMPGETGFDLAKSVRKTSQVPILMLTARAETEHRINGLEIGADDYMAKPFEARELSLRVASILKRAQPAAAPPAESVRFGPFVFHMSRGELRRGDELIHLTDREKDILRLLAATPGQTVQRLALAGTGAAAGRARGSARVHPPAPQDRARSRQSAVPAGGTGRRLPASGPDMTSLDVGFARFRTAAERVFAGYGRLERLFKGFLPKGLYARALFIIIAPMLILQLIVTYLFLERHWHTVTQRLSAAVV